MSVKEVRKSDNFKKAYGKVDKSLKTKLNKLILKIIDNPEVGKPMRYGRKETRGLYIKPFRISYIFK
jgi:glycyl-tRNA synthetase beta subunit